MAINGAVKGRQWPQRQDHFNTKPSAWRTQKLHAPAMSFNGGEDDGEAQTASP